MTLVALLGRSLRRTVRRHGMITVLLVMLVLATVAVSWAAGSASYGTSRSIADGLGSRQIEVIQGYGGPESPDLSRAAVSELEKLDHVQEVFPSGSSGIDPPAAVLEAAETLEPWWLMPQNPFDDRLKVADGAQAPVLATGQMLVVPEHHDLVGTTIEVGTTKALDASNGTAVPERFDVVGTYDPESVQGEVPGAVFIEANQFDAIQARALPPGAALYSSIYLYVDDVVNVAAVQAEVERLGFGARSAIGSGIQLDQARQNLLLTSILLSAITVLSALFAGATVSGAWMTARVEEIGLFRSLGWTRRRIVRFYLLEAVAYAAAVAVAGVLLGAAVVQLLVAFPQPLISLAGVQLGAGALGAQLWVVFLPLIFVPLGFALGTSRRAATLLRADADSLLRQL